MTTVADPVGRFVVAGARVVDVVVAAARFLTFCDAAPTSSVDFGVVALDDDDDDDDDDAELPLA